MSTKAGWEHWLGYSAAGITFTKIPNITEATLNVSIGDDDETSFDTAPWSASYPGIRSGNITGTMWKDNDIGGDGTSGIYEVLRGYWLAGTRFYVQLLDGIAGDGLEAQCFFTSWEESAPATGRASCSFDIKLTGTISAVENGA